MPSSSSSRTADKLNIVKLGRMHRVLLESIGQSPLRVLESHPDPKNMKKTIVTKREAVPAGHVQLKEDSVMLLQKIHDAILYDLFQNAHEIAVLSKRQRVKLHHILRALENKGKRSSPPRVADSGLRSRTRLFLGAVFEKSINFVSGNALGDLRSIAQGIVNAIFAETVKLERSERSKSVVNKDGEKRNNSIRLSPSDFLPIVEGVYSRYFSDGVFNINLNGISSLSFGKVGVVAESKVVTKSINVQGESVKRGVRKTKAMLAGLSGLSHLGTSRLGNKLSSKKQDKEKVKQINKSAKKAVKKAVKSSSLSDPISHAAAVQQRK